MILLSTLDESRCPFMMIICTLVSSIGISELLQKAFSCIRLFSITLDFMVFIGIGLCLDMVHILKALFAR